MTSGNLLADRRMAFARDLHARGDTADALEILEQALELAPGWVEGRFLRGEWLDAAGRRDDAVAAYKRCLELDPADRMGAVLRLALLGAVATPPVLPPAYVAGVFDEYAERFESALLERLDYTVPAELHALVRSLAGDGATYGRVLDLGCGTGLAGERFRTGCSWLEGVDLSERMVAQARRKSVYDLLEVGDARGFLATTPRSYDLILAADVLVYLGELAPLAAAVARVLAPSGRFALSVEATAGDGFRLTAGHRYAHSEAYLRRIVGEAGLAVEVVAETTCRLEAGSPLPAFLLVARRPPADGARRDGDAAASPMRPPLNL